MEYCGGGDLSTIIKQAAKLGRPLPEDTIWQYFLQIVQALHHCHHHNGHSRSGSGSTINGNVESSQRVQILHRDLKPDNGSPPSHANHLFFTHSCSVFLDEHYKVKLGDFGLSRALAQPNFATTYVGVGRSQLVTRIYSSFSKTPYYMSPELIQEKAYDSKSDIWSLGCVIYELCALKPPFHEAKTPSELSIFIWCVHSWNAPSTISLFEQK